MSMIRSLISTRDNGAGTMEHELLNGRRGVGKDGQAWHLDTDSYNRVMNMQFYRGPFADPGALQAAHPSDVVGAYAVVLSTGTFWIWQSAAEGWADTGSEVTEVAGLPPGGLAGQVLAKASDVDNDVGWADADAPLPAGGLTGQVLAKASDADNDAEWVDQSGGKEIHNDLNGLQGGTATERFHLTDRQHDLVEDIQLARPVKPTNISPVDGDTNVLATGPFESSPYGNPYGGDMYGYQIEITDIASGAVIYDSGNVETISTRYVLADGILLPSLEYSWRVRYQGGNLEWSRWSEGTSFTAAASFENVVHTPSLLLPANGTVYNSPYPTLLLTPFSASVGLEQGEGDFEISNVSDFSNIVDAGLGRNMYSGQVGLSRGVPYYARARHRAITGETSMFSAPSAFSIKTMFRGQRIGIALVDEESLVFWRIDGNYVPVDIDDDYWLDNTIWSAWNESLNMGSDGVAAYTDIDGQKMIRVPAFWIKSGRIPSGPLEGKRFWLVDPTTPTAEEQADGWRIHAMFAHPGGGYQDSMLVSAYRISFVNSVAVSSGAFPAGQMVANLSAAVNKRNTDPDDPLKRGWSLMPYYTIQAFALLAMIEHASADKFRSLVCEANATHDSFGYRGVKLWNGGTPYAVLMYGLYNGSASTSRLVDSITLPKPIMPTDAILTGDQWKISHVKTRGFLSSEDGIPAILRFEDYLIPKPVSPTEMTTSGSPWADILVRDWRGSIDLTLPTSFAHFLSPRDVLSVGSADAANGVFAANAMMVKYD